MVCGHLPASITRAAWRHGELHRIARVAGKRGLSSCRSSCFSGASNRP
jgi:hypothetical protein